MDLDPQPYDSVNMHQDSESSLQDTQHHHQQPQSSSSNSVKREGSDQPVLPPKRVRRKPGMPVQPVPRSSKKPGELLTADEKKANHIASEQKRRHAIREGFDKITAIVPDLDKSQGRSEATVLTETVKFLHNLIDENEALTKLAASMNIEIPEDVRSPQMPASSASPSNEL